MLIKSGFAKHLANINLRFLGVVAIAGLMATTIPSNGFAQDKDETKESKEVEKADAEPSTKDKFDSLLDKLSEEVGKLGEEHSEAETKDERAAIAQRRREVEKLIADDVIGLTREEDNEAKSIKMLADLLARQVKGEARTGLIKEIESKYKDSEKLAPFVNAMVKIKSPTEQIEKTFHKIIKTSPSDSVKASTTLALVSYLDAVKTKAASLKKPNPYMESRDGDELDKEVESLLAVCAEKYSDVKMGKTTYGKVAAKKLALRMIKVGAVAPNIKGVDLDDVKFQLADYRGKVVVIDFWGDW